MRRKGVGNSGELIKLRIYKTNSKAEETVHEVFLKMEVHRIDYE